MLTILEWPDSRLTQVCEPCDLNDRTLKKLSKRMFKMMYNNNGVGLAGPQVGVMKRIATIDCQTETGAPNPILLINPTIVETRGLPEIEGEGCLSCPGVTIPILRSPWVRVQYYDLKGDLWEIESDGLLGRCLQHEIDHLDGKTLFETCAPADRIEAIADYEMAKKMGAQPGDTGISAKVN